MGFANDIRNLGAQQRAGAIHWRPPGAAGIKPALAMVGRSTRWGVAGVALANIGGCHGGLTVQGLVLLVTVGIFVGTILLERSP